MNRKAACVLFVVGLLIPAGLALAAADKPSTPKQTDSKALPPPDKAKVLLRFTKIEVQEASAEYFGATVIRASLLKPDGQPLAGKPVAVKVGSQPPDNVQTSRGGAVALQYKIPESLLPGTYPVEVSFAGDKSAPAGLGKGTLDVRKAETYIHFHPKNQFPVLPVKGENVSIHGYLRRKLDDRSVPDGTELFVYMNGSRSTAKVNGGYDSEGGCFNFKWIVPEGVTEVTVKTEFGGDPRFLPATGTYAFKAQQRPPGKAHMRWDFGDTQGAVGQEITLKARVVQEMPPFGGEPADWSSTAARGVRGVVRFISRAPGDNWHYTTVPGEFSSCSANTDAGGWASCKTTLTKPGIAIVGAFFEATEERWDVHLDTNKPGTHEAYVKITSQPAPKKAYIRWDFGPDSGPVGQEIILKARILEDDSPAALEPDQADWYSSMEKGVQGEVVFEEASYSGRLSPRTCRAKTDAQGWASCKVRLTEEGTAYIGVSFEAAEPWVLHKVVIHPAKGYPDLVPITITK